jgi:hypothetical protein
MLEDPFGEGWLYVLSPKRLGPALRGMLVGDEAVGWMREELARLRASIAGIASADALVGATLPDGGVPLDGLAGRLDEPQWDQVSDAFFGSRGTEGPEGHERFVDPFSM